MKANKALISHYLNQTPKGKERDAAAALIKDYEDACVLSRGKNPSRSAHWEHKGKKFESEIKRKCPQFTEEPAMAS
jgi:hypothetical protein